MHICIRKIYEKAMCDFQFACFVSFRNVLFSAVEISGSSSSVAETKSLYLWILVRFWQTFKSNRSKLTQVRGMGQFFLK